jgi:AbiV family abortive infection protein
VASKPHQWRKATKPVFLKGMRRCLANARRLLKAARALHRTGSHNAAFVLGALALEEVGKVVYFTLVSHSQRERLRQEDAEAIHKLFFDHSAKVQLALNEAWRTVLRLRRRKDVPLSLVGPGDWRLRRAHQTVDKYLERTRGADDIAAMKLEALYVGSRRNLFSEPPRVPLAIAAGMILIVETAVKDAGRLRDTFRRSKRDRLVGAIARVDEQLLQAQLDELAQARRVLQALLRERALDNVRASNLAQCLEIMKAKGLIDSRWAVREFKNRQSTRVTFSFEP